MIRYVLIIQLKAVKGFYIEYLYDMNIAMTTICITYLLVINSLILAGASFRIMNALRNDLPV